MLLLKHAAGILIAGVLAIAAVLTASLLTSPMHSSEHGVEEDGTSAGRHPRQDPAEQIIGVWRAPGPANQDAFVEFTDFGLWNASDGCNQTQGGWELSADGSFRSLGGGAMTQIGCDNVPIPTAVGGAQSTAFDAEGRLVLIHENGAATSLVGRWAGPGSGSELTLVEFADDGSWSGHWGCHEFQGIWDLGLHEDLLSHSQDSAPFIGLGPVVLSIGPEPAGHNIVCLDSEESFFPLAYEADYWFGMTRNSFWIHPVAGPGSLPLSFPTYYRLAADEHR